MKRNYGFTLIEMLVVIVLIGILSAVVIVFIDPKKHNERANQAVMISQLTKLCNAATACMAGRSDPDVNYCWSSDTDFSAVMANTPLEPDGALYQIIRGTDIPGDYINANAWLAIRGTLGSCRISCRIENDYVHTTTPWDSQSPGGLIKNLNSTWSGLESSNPCH